MSASYFPLAASFLAASGNSKAPGTRTTFTSLLAAPARPSASAAAASSRSVMKLLNRLTTIANRRPSAFSPPSNFCGSSFPAISDFPRTVRVALRVSLAAECSFPLFPLPHLLPLLPLELRLPLLQKRLRSFMHVVRSATQPDPPRFDELAFFLGHLRSALDRFDDVFHRERRVGDNFLRQVFGSG